MAGDQGRRRAWTSSLVILHFQNFFTPANDQCGRPHFTPITRSSRPISIRWPRVTTPRCSVTCFIPRRAIILALASASLFEDNVPATVYDSLIAAVHKHLPTNHRYLALRRRALKIPDVRMYDTYAPIVSGVHTHNTWEQAAKTVTDALAPLGDEYCRSPPRGIDYRPLVRSLSQHR